jgi:hypothetical protein
MPLRQPQTEPPGTSAENGVRSGGRRCRRNGLS